MIFSDTQSCKYPITGKLGTHGHVSYTKAPTEKELCVTLPKRYLTGTPIGHSPQHTHTHLSIKTVLYHFPSSAFLSNQMQSSSRKPHCEFFNAWKSAEHTHNKNSINI